MADKTKLNKQEEEFAKNLFLGDSQREAYKKAFKQCKNWKDKTIDEKACRLAGTDKIKTRLAELQERMSQKVSESALLSATDVLNDIKDIIQANKLEDPKTALKGLELYGKHLKLFTDKVESVNVNHNLNEEVLTPEQRKARIKELLDKNK